MVDVLRERIDNLGQWKTKKTFLSEVAKIWSSALDIGKLPDCDKQILTELKECLERIKAERLTKFYTKLIEAVGEPLRSYMIEMNETNFDLPCPTLTNGKKCVCIEIRKEAANRELTETEKISIENANCVCAGQGTIPGPVPLPPKLSGNLLRQIEKHGGGGGRESSLQLQSGRSLFEIITSRFTDYIQRICTLEELDSKTSDQSDFKIRLSQYYTLPGFYKANGEVIDMTLKKRGPDLQLSEDTTVQGLIEYIQKYGSAVQTLYKYLEENDHRARRYYRGKPEDFLKHHKNLGYMMCWEKARAEFNKDEGETWLNTFTKRQEERLARMMRDSL